VSTSTSKVAIESIVVRIVEDLVQDWGINLDGGINNQTFMVSELEFASVDIIQLCVAIEQHYNTKFGFQDLLMDNGRYISDLSVAQMAEFLHKKLEE
jgi:acyl carrier protein